MAFPSITGSQPNTLDQAWSQSRQLASQVKSVASTTLAGSGAGLTGQQLINLAAALGTLYGSLQTLAAVPGLAAYAQAQMNNPSLDVVGAFNAMTAAMVNTVTWITTNFPKDVNSNLLFLQFTGQGQTVATTFSPSQIAPLVTLLQALVATID